MKELYRTKDKKLATDFLFRMKVGEWFFAKRIKDGVVFYSKKNVEAFRDNKQGKV